MAKSRRAHRTRRYRGGGVQTSQQFFNPDVLPPMASAFAPVPSSAPTSTEIRPVLLSTFAAPQSGGATRRRRQRGGFSPSIMGGFAANAQAAIVPAALYLVYHTFVAKKTRRNSRK